MSVIEIVGGAILLAKVTRIAGVVFFVVAILACLFTGRLAG